MNLPEEKRPRQKPRIKTEASGEIILASYPELVKRHPSPESTNVTSEAFFSKLSRGDQLAKYGDHASALRCYEEARSIDPNYPNNYLSHIRVGDIFFNIEKNMEAIEAYEGAIASNPGDAQAYDLRGDVYFRLKEHDKALNSYNQALEIEPENSEYLKDKGSALYGLKDYENASTWFDKAIATNPNNVSALRYKGDILQRLKHYEEAIECFDKILEIVPNDVDALKSKGSALHSSRAKKRPEGTNGEKYGTRQAIIVGINRYEDSEIPSLRGAENDAVEILQRLQDKGNFDISEGHLLIGRDATKRNILRALSDLFRRQANADVVVIYFSGYAFVDENNVGYIAPYDMDSEDPFIVGINMEQLRNIIYESKNKASLIMLVDCCHSGITAKDKIKSGAVTGAALDRDRNLISTQFQKMVESPSQQGTQVTARGAVILASSEANAVSRERNYKHSENDEPHSHGAFTFHLLEGIDGKASNESGVITMGSLKKYVEDKMIQDDRQLPVHYVAGASRIDSIHIAISEDQFRGNVDKLLKTARDRLGVKYSNSELIDFQSLRVVAKKTGELASLDPNNKELPQLREGVENGIATYAQPTIEWLMKNMEYLRIRINTISPGLFDFKLPDMVQHSII